MYIGEIVQKIKTMHELIIFLRHLLGIHYMRLHSATITSSMSSNPHTTIIQSLTEMLTSRVRELGM